ncbi:amidase domain-containing protein [Actinosynnema sp. CA-248983]
MSFLRRSMLPSAVAVALLAGASAPALAAPAKALDEGLLVSAAQEFLQHRADTLVSGRVTAHGVSTLAGGAIGTAGEIRSAESAASTALTGRKQRLAEAGESYTAARTEITSSAVHRRGADVDVVVQEQTTLDYAKIRGDEPAHTGFAAERTFRFSRIGGQWVLVSQHLTDQGGPLPVTEPTVVGQVAARPTDEAAAIDKPATTGSDKITTAAYNYQAMADYAVRYVYNYNPAYRTFADVGGDCTNFISQALKAGGWAHVSGWYRDYRHWWYNSLNETWSWINVNSWASFARHSGRTSHLSNVWYLGLADILQMDFTANSSKDHSMIVTYRSSSMPYLTYHTTNTLNRSLQSLLDSYRGALYYAFRT